jgi:hypothetical protein
MDAARYDVVKAGDGWTIDRDGRREGDYATKEAAFEAAVLAASNAIKQGHRIRITVPERAPTESAVGGRP